MDLRAFDLNLLRALDALLREGSTVKAGERIGLSQPAVSAALGRLRVALSDDLFVRQGQGLVPTEYARSLEMPLRDILDGVSDILAGAQAFDPARARRDFRISGSDFFSELLMPQLADEIEAEAPSVRVQLVDLVPDNYVDTLERYRVDIAIMPRVPFADWIGRQHVFNSTFVMVARRGHPRLTRAGVQPGDTCPLDLFCDLGFVLMSPEGRFEATGDAALSRLGRTRKVVMTMPFFSGVVRAVEGSDLVALIPQQLAHRFAAGSTVDIYQPPMAMPAAELYMIWHKRFTSDPAHRWLRDKVARLLLPLNDGEAPLET